MLNDFFLSLYISDMQWPSGTCLWLNAHSLTANKVLSPHWTHSEPVRLDRKTLRVFSAHNLTQAPHWARGAVNRTLGFRGWRPKWPLRFYENALADTPLHSAESHQLCRGTARAEGGDSSNNMATTAVSPQSFPHLQSCNGFLDSL